MSGESKTRKCILSGIVKNTEELLRFVEFDNVLLPDFNKKLPAKGMYVTNNRLSLQKALEKKLFNKVSRHNLKIDENITDMVENLLKQQALSAINLARKSGNIVIGFEKVKEVLKKDKVDFMIEASNAGADGKEKLALFAKSIEIFNKFSIDELDMALNRENTVHIAVLKSDVSKMVYNNLKKFENFLSENGENNE